MRPVLAIMHVVGCFLMAGCGSMASLNDAGQKVIVIEQPWAGCTYVGVAYGRSHSHEYAMNNLRNAIGLNGGTHVVVTNTSQITQGAPFWGVPASGDSLTLNGIGYRCRDKGSASR